MYVQHDRQQHYPKPPLFASPFCLPRHQFRSISDKPHTKFSIHMQADGIIINRGTLGLDVLPEKMAMVQKTLIKVRRV